MGRFEPSAGCIVRRERVQRDVNVVADSAIGLEQLQRLRLVVDWQIPVLALVHARHVVRDVDDGGLSRVVAAKENSRLAVSKPKCLNQLRQLRSVL
eukprot:2893556-Pleurochrysis_carterae.AAC.1